MEIISWAFERLRLHTVYAECYMNNPSIKFWGKVFKGQYDTVLPNRKYIKGDLYYSKYYSWSNA